MQYTFHSSYTAIRGDFRFDALVDHFKSHKAPFIVSISEDTTSVIKKVEYDISTNRCIGFVLPNNKDGLPKGVADSFAKIKIYFKTAGVSNYAYLYAFQPLKQGQPSFCLSVIGTNNKYRRRQITLWKYIYFAERNNFFADRDSRLIKAMRITLTIMYHNLLTKIIINPPFNGCVQICLH